MCGIFAMLNNESKFKKEFILEQFMKGKGRGPEFSKLDNFSLWCLLGFHRLAINGLNYSSNQPIMIGDIALICNGEIYNYKELYDIMGETPTTQSDCEVIVHLYKKYGMKQTLQMLDGVFAFVLCDYSINNNVAKIYIARDPYGVRPLYVLKPSRDYKPENNYVGQCDNQKQIYSYASELKVLSEFAKELPNYTVEHFQPGTYSKIIMEFKVSPKWELKKEHCLYHSTGFSSVISEQLHDTKLVFKNIQYYLSEAVKKRVLVTERPIACLLSGGLDSSLITALVNEVHKQKSDKPLETFSIGLEGSEDLKYARIVADYLGTNHTEILLTEEEFVESIPDVIVAIESYDTTTVRASIGNYLLGKYISENSDAKVIFNGDGSDELCGGYLYMHAAPDAIEFDKECRRLLKHIHAFDVLRSDKCISSHGLEPRTPFLDRTWVQHYLSIHPSLRFHKGNNQCEKFLLRSAFSEENYLDSNGSALLPKCVLWRTKEAFSDGVSKTTRSLYEIIQEKVEELTNTATRKSNYEHNLPDTTEKKYYRDIFEEAYPGMGNVVPYFWMPRYVEAKDASARTLQIYSAVKAETTY
jgi:asparagine synthase (glutamine-hydrolysing)